MFRENYVNYKNIHIFSPLDNLNLEFIWPVFLELKSELHALVQTDLSELILSG